jgi:hypothetical protein
MLFLRTRLCALVAAGVTLVVAGCSGGMTTIDSKDGGSSSGGSSGSSSGSSGDGGPCRVNADCGTTQFCAFKIGDGCTATGTCFDAAPPGFECPQVYSPGCACDGTEINVACGYPAGYDSQPVAHTGACTSGDDAGGGGSCNTDADCGTGKMCAFKISDGCTAVGACITKPPPGPVCAAYSPACTCSGQEINVVCTQYPSGYASTPVAHTGVCTMSDAGASSFACGAGTTCSVTQVCKIGMGGAVGNPTSYACVDYPSQCVSMHTCACVKAALGATQCTESGGNVTTTFFYPGVGAH